MSGSKRNRLGAIFAGGASRRFGSDKAVAPINGVAMLDRVAAALAPQCDRIAVVGRDWPGLDRIDDRPAPGLGPLGALAGALVAGEAWGFEDVLTAGCDLPDIPADLAALLTPGPAVIAGQPLLGLWPIALGPVLLDYLTGNEDRSMARWIAAAGARRIPPPRPIANINRPEELAAYLARRS